MENTSQLKDDLINKIKATNDVSFLKALQTIIDASIKDPYQLSQHQLNAVAESRAQLENGDYVENEDFMSEVEQWLEKE